MDVGAGSSVHFARHLASQGSEVHVLDVGYDPKTMPDGWGFASATVEENPQLTFHNGLAGDERTPGNYYDLVTCISVMEHIYDHAVVVDPTNPFPHLAAIRDMVRMLRPGGFLVLTYDFFLNDLEHYRGWDYLMDIKALQMSGVPLASYDRELRSRTYIHNHEDTLFMEPEVVLSFSDRFLRITSIGMVFRRPGTKALVSFRPNPELKNVLFPPAELARNARPKRIEAKGDQLRQLQRKLRSEILAIRRSTRTRMESVPDESSAPQPEDFSIRQLVRGILIRIGWRLRRRGQRSDLAFHKLTQRW